MKKILALVLVLGLVLGLAACTPANGTTAAATTAAATTAAASQAASETTAAAPAGKIKIGYACPNINNTFQTYLVDAAKAYAAANNIELTVTDAQQDVVTQQDQIKTLIQQGVQALMVTPADTSAMASVTKAAQDAGIPIVYFNTNPFKDEASIPDGAFYVGSQEITAGNLQIGEIAKLLNGKGNVCILMGGLTYEASTERTKGVEDMIKEKYPDMKVLAKETADWQREKAVSVTENWLTTYGKEINAIFANNDEMALGAIKSLQAQGRKDVLVAGIDATPDAVKAIQDGTLTCTVFQDAKGQSEGAMKIAVNAVNKVAIPSKIQWIPYVLVNKDNVAQYAGKN